MLIFKHTYEITYMKNQSNIKKKLFKTYLNKVKWNLKMVNREFYMNITSIILYLLSYVI